MLHRPDPDAIPDATKALLGWYDKSRRTLPWRAAPGQPSDPYAVWLSEIMLQQTTVASVKPYFEKFLARWPSVAALGKAEPGDVLSAWAGLGYYSRARNLHACAGKILADHDGRFPESEVALLTLPGIGAYTAAAISSIAFGHRAVVVDGNVERVISRYFAISDPLPHSKSLIRSRTDTLTPARRAGDFAQGMMDLGATICTPRNPACGLCPLSEGCIARAQGIAADLPAKLPKAAKPTRRGAAFVALRSDGALLVRTRSEKGLLGGMTEVPGTDWIEGDDMPVKPEGAPVLADWRNTGRITHVFTHFRLELVVFAAELSSGTLPSSGCTWLAPEDIADAALPILMRKVLARAQA